MKLIYAYLSQQISPGERPRAPPECMVPDVVLEFHTVSKDALGSTDATEEAYVSLPGLPVEQK